MKKSLLIIILVATFIFGFVLFFAGKSPMFAIIVGLLLYFLVYALWNPPQKHEESSKIDKMKAIDRALGEPPVDHFHDNHFHDHN